MSDIRGTLGDGEFGYLVTDVVVGENRSGSDGDGIGTIGERTDAACAAGKHMYTDQRRVVLGRSNDTANRDAHPPPWARAGNEHKRKANFSSRIFDFCIVKLLSVDAKEGIKND